MSEIKTNRELAQEISARIGNAPIPFDSVYSICLEIYNELGGEPAEFDSVYSILLETLPLAESIAKKTSITEVDELPEANDNNNIYRLSSDDNVYMSTHVSTEYTNRLPDKQQIDKAYIYDDAVPENPRVYYYKGLWKIICSDGEIEYYGWLDKDYLSGDWLLYITNDNADNFNTATTLFNSVSSDDYEGIILDVENKTVTVPEAEKEEYIPTMPFASQMPDCYYIPAIYNAPEADCIGNAYFSNSADDFDARYTGDEVIYNNEIWYKWTTAEDEYYYITNKKASEIYGKFSDYWVSDVSLLYCNNGVYETPLYVDINNIYIPQLNAPDSEQVGKAYVAGENNLTYVGEKQLHCSDGDITVYYWGTPGNKNLSTLSKTPAENTYVLDDGSPIITDGLESYWIKQASWVDYNTLTFNGTVNEFNTYYEHHTSDLYIKNLVKYTRAIENWEWKQIVTKEYVDNGFAKLSVLTQAQYDALATKDAHTLYIISDAQ